MKTSLIEQEGKFYKECDVVRLMTTNIENSLKGYLDESILFNYQKEYKTIPAEEGFTGYFHLYVIGNDEIKDGDWCFHTNQKSLIQIGVNEGKLMKGHLYLRKIIATTDTSLGLPQPSDKFIQAFIEAYNQGTPIEKVLIEYSSGQIDIDTMSLEEMYQSTLFQPKLKDNNTIIKKIKTEYTREDMIHALTYGCREGKLGRTHSDILTEYKQNHL